ncbi:helix-turn-helix domain-containing protein [Lutibacter sp. B1]|uniref:winged helix-turn-helix transcriptional regulator n=1 Tax=Lutibacter sp. B1 TaxID=2725996 RepID=UPI0014566739|nr:helix-turn-helix domain-containing protein [Lutibacter sp. B1]NLP59256.1 helix-turn-helix transcriptional regulator [Lutibacter sp. B1]
MENLMETKIEEVKKCSVKYVLALNDALNVINGKWKTPIIGSLLFGKMRFKELERNIENISPRMLSKELKDLEINGIIKRTVYDTIPVTVEYELTESGKTFQTVIDVMVEWAVEHRQRTFS